jgi:hypothetical protein
MSNVAAWAATRRRAVRLSPMTSSVATASGDQPRSPAISSANLPFRLMDASMACMSGTTDFTSTIRTTRAPGCHARMSTEPRSPRIQNVASRTTSQPARRSRPATASTSRACTSSRSRSSASPFQLSRRSVRAPRAPATASSFFGGTDQPSPRSMRATIVGLTLAPAARSRWRHLRRRRSARMPRPKRTMSIGRAWQRPLIRRLVARFLIETPRHGDHRVEFGERCIRLACVGGSVRDPRAATEDFPSTVRSERTGTSLPCSPRSGPASARYRWARVAPASCSRSRR